MAVAAAAASERASAALARVRAQFDRAEHACTRRFEQARRQLADMEQAELREIARVRDVREKVLAEHANMLQVTASQLRAVEGRPGPLSSRIAAALADTVSVWQGGRRLPCPASFEYAKEVRVALAACVPPAGAVKVERVWDEASGTLRLLLTDAEDGSVFDAGAVCAPAPELGVQLDPRAVPPFASCVWVFPGLAASKARDAFWFALPEGKVVLLPSAREVMLFRLAKGGVLSAAVTVPLNHVKDAHFPEFGKCWVVPDWRRGGLYWAAEAAQGEFVRVGVDPEPLPGNRARRLGKRCAALHGDTALLRVEVDHFLGRNMAGGRTLRVRTSAAGEASICWHWMLDGGLLVGLFRHQADRTWAVLLFRSAEQQARVPLPAHWTAVYKLTEESLVAQADDGRHQVLHVCLEGDGGNPALAEGACAVVPWARFGVPPGAVTRYMVAAEFVLACVEGAGLVALPLKTGTR